MILRVLSLAAAFASLLSAQTWNLKSGPVEYRLRRDGKTVRLEYFGPAGLENWKMGPQRRGGPLPSQDLLGSVEGQPVTPDDLELIGQESKPARPGVPGLQLTYRHARLPLEIEAAYAAWGDTGVITRTLKLTNHGAQALHVEWLPELAMRLPPGQYELTYLWGGWGQEKQMATERLGAGRRTLANLRGRSTSLYSPWFSLRNLTSGVRYAAELAYSGNWQMSFERLPGTANILLEENDLQVNLGTSFDFEGALALRPGESRTLPVAAFTATAGDLDDAANQLHRFQRSYVFPRTPANDPLLVQFNSWYPFPGKMTVAEMKSCADVAAELGAEVFVLDAGWYNKRNWSTELGDYEADRVAFPNGIEELSRHVRRKGMKFGIWVEIENVGTGSEMIRKHPGWLLAYDGKPIVKNSRAMLDFSKPEVRAWAHSVVDRLVKDYALEWIKIDYNIDIGNQFGPPALAERGGAVLFDHIHNYYAWLDQVRRKHPGLVIENCSSGGLRFDPGIMAHTHTTWLSDVVAPLPSVQLAYGCTVAFSPEVCNHWMVGDGEAERGHVDQKAPPGWWDFMLRVPMNGQYGISSRVFEWGPALRKRAAENVAIYKRIRRVIAGADTYHLTPPPSNQGPTGWMGLQYVSADRKRSVVMAYRLGKSRPEQRLHLRGLNPSVRYKVTADGVAGQTTSQEELSVKGLPVRLDAEWRAAVIELQAERR